MPLITKADVDAALASFDTAVDNAAGVVAQVSNVAAPAVGFAQALAVTTIIQQTNAESGVIARTMSTLKQRAASMATDIKSLLPT